MRLHVLCDLHLEFGCVEIPSVNADVVVLAGDIHLGHQGCAWAQQKFPSKPVIYLCGNHEYYRHTIPGLLNELKSETKNTNVHLLENDAIEICGWTFLGCTLWTDFALEGDATVAMRLADVLVNDYRLIGFGPEKRPLRPIDTARMHAQSVNWLRKALAKSDPKRTIVATHHSPSGRSEAPHHAASPLKPAFSSDLDALIKKSGVPLWIYGHTHWNTEFKIGFTRLITNQRGYPEEPCRGFDPGLVIEL